MAKDPYKYFRIEARELIDGLAKGLLDLERNADAELVARMLRLAHTLKGAARIVKQREIADRAHALEDLLAPLRTAPVAQRLDRGLAITDEMTAALAALPGPERAEPAAPTEPTAAPDVPEASGLPHVDVRAADDMLAGLAEVHALLGRIRALPQATGLTRQLEQLDRELQGVRYDAERLRLLPIGSVFTSLERTARDAALALGKRVAFSGIGGEVRADAHVLGAIHGALIQLVRNAVAHGIERPDQRTAAGKSAEGSVKITVKPHGRRLAITCEDDGAGFDLDAIRQAAQRAAPGAPTSEDDLVRTLLAGGISTSSEVSEISGRGIGLNVVNEAALSLDGQVTAQTRRGAGAAITLAVPVSVAATTALIVQSADRTAAIPLDAVRRVERVSVTQLLRGPDGVSIAFDDIMVRHAPLVRLLGGQGDLGTSVVFVESGDGVAAVGVDRVLGVDDVVVRSLPADVPIDPIVWGVALESTGRPRPVLDPAALVAAIRRDHSDPAVPPPRVIRVLVIDDSLTTRMLEQSILESAGYQVLLATSAEEALELLARDRPDLILCDVEMPGMDGFGFVTEIRARPPLAAIPAILVTSRDAAEDRRRGIAAGAQGYVVKGQFDQVALLAMIKRLVRT